MEQPKRIITGANRRVIDHGEIIARVDLRAAARGGHGLYVGERWIALHACVLQDDVVAVHKNASTVPKPSYALERDVVSVTNVECLAPMLDLDSHNRVVTPNVVAVSMIGCI